jgi:hypothetical protein
MTPRTARIVDSDSAAPFTDFDVDGSVCSDSEPEQVQCSDVLGHSVSFLQRINNTSPSDASAAQTFASERSLSSMHSAHPVARSQVQHAAALELAVPPQREDSPQHLYVGRVTSRHVSIIDPEDILQFQQQQQHHHHHHHHQQQQQQQQETASDSAANAHVEPPSCKSQMKITNFFRPSAAAASDGTQFCAL